MPAERPWVLVLGASGGMGSAACRAFARAGYEVAGVHLDRRSGLAAVQALRAELEAAGARSLFFNLNAARDDARQQVVEALRAELGGRPLRVLLHALAFGALGPLVPPPGSDERPLRRRQLEMTLDVMASSLVYWVRDLVAAGLLAEGSRVFALTSAGSERAVPAYGAVSMAKAALEAAVRQLALELAPRGITANAVMAGVTPTPALLRIPGHERLLAEARARNPHGRLGRPEDVARCLVELSRPGTSWMTGNVLRVDGGESISG